MNDKVLILDWFGYAQNGVGLSLREFSKKANIDYKYLFQLKSGKRTPRKETILKICNALGITFDEYIAGVDAYKLGKTGLMSNQIPQQSLETEDSIRLKIIDMVGKINGAHLKYLYQATLYIYRNYSFVNGSTEEHFIQR